MNRPTNYLPQEDPDQLLFNYLEGSLSPAEEEALEKRLLSDSLLQEELDSWKETYVAQDFYPTEALEKKILANTPRPFMYYRFGAGTLLLTGIIISLFYMWPLGEALKESPGPVSKVSAPTGEQMPTTAEHIETAEPALDQQAVASGVLRKPSATASAEKSENIYLPDPVLQEVLPVAVKLEPEADANQAVLPEVPLRMEKVKIQAERPIFAISKKEQRKINRMKRKSQEKRMAREFIKGNRPYVVPLNTQNF